MSSTAVHSHGPKFGLILALIGALVITPDTLMMRLSGLEGWSMSAWRGLLIGTSMMCIWAVLSRGRWRSDLALLGSAPSLVVIAATAGNNLAFNFAVVETSITVVLTTLAISPIIAAVLSYFILKEVTQWRTRAAIFFALIGVLIVIFNGHDAVAAPTGNVLLGGFFGFLGALGIAIVFVWSRRNSNLPILLAVAVGTVLSGLVGLAQADFDDMANGNYYAILAMGLVIMPIAWTCLSLAPRYTSPTNVSLFMLLEMVLGPVWVWAGTNETPSQLMILGAVIVLITLIIYTISSANSHD